MFRFPVGRSSRSPKHFAIDLEPRAMQLVLLITIALLQLCVASNNATSCAVYGCGARYDPSQPCQCNRQCSKYKNCCSDYNEECPALIFKECIEAPLIPEDRRHDKKRLKIATFNANFLFLKGISALRCPGPDCNWKSISHAKTHVEAVAHLIKRMDVDILQLAEVEDCEALEALAIEIKKIGDDSYRPYLIRGQDRFTGQNVALITRIDPIEAMQRSEERVEYPLVDSKCNQTIAIGDGDSSSSSSSSSSSRSSSMQIRGDIEQLEKTKSVSKHFFTRFKVDGLDRNITMVGVHFLANPSDIKRCYQREAQATVISQIVDQSVSKYGDEVIVLGDYNDFDRRVPDIRSNQPISQTLDIIRNSGYGLKSVVAHVDQKLRYTNWWDRDRDCIYRVPEEVSQLDHMFMSNYLHSKIDNVHIGNDLFEQVCGTDLSDHFPIIATLNL